MAIVIVGAGLLIGALLNWASDAIPHALGRQVDGPTHKLWHSWLMWLVEALAVGLAVSLWLQGNLSVILVVECSLFVLIALVDLKHRVVPNVLIYPAIAASLILTVIAAPERIVAVLVGGGLAFGVFGLTRLVRPGTLGAGDIKLAGLLGLLFGFPQILWVLLVGGAAGGLSAGYLLLARRSDARMTIPYAPFLSLGALIAVFYDPLSGLMGR